MKKKKTKRNRRKESVSKAIRDKANYGHDTINHDKLQELKKK